MNFTAQECHRKTEFLEIEISISDNLHYRLNFDSDKKTTSITNDRKTIINLVALQSLVLKSCKTSENTACKFYEFINYAQKILLLLFIIVTILFKYGAISPPVCKNLQICLQGEN